MGPSGLLTLSYAVCTLWPLMRERLSEKLYSQGGSPECDEEEGGFFWGNSINRMLTESEVLTFIPMHQVGPLVKL